MQPSHWFSLCWPPSWADVDISVTELVPIVVAAALWGRAWGTVLGLLPYEQHGGGGHPPQKNQCGSR